MSPRASVRLEPSWRGLAALALVVCLVASGCSASREVRTSLDAGRRAMSARAFRDAILHFRAAVTLAPDSADAHALRGEAAEALGEFDEALEAYGAAARLSTAAAHRQRLGQIAARTGRTEVAVKALDGAEGPWREHALVGSRAGTATFLLCSSPLWPRIWEIAPRCVPPAMDRGRTAFRSSHEGVAQYAFQILLEEGQRERALAFARARGWVQDGVEYCSPARLPITGETAAMLAILLQPERADCAVTFGARVGDDGLARLGRLMLRDRVERSTSAEVRAQAAWLLRYRLPAHDPAKLAESLNVTGWRLQNRFKRPGEALDVFQRAIQADPRFSWPYHNIGRLYMSQNDHETALGWLEKAVELNPDHWRAQFNLGVTAHRLHRYDAALAAYTRANVISPDDADTHANLGWVLLKLGREAEGVRELQTAVRLDPSLERERQYLDGRFGRDARHSPSPFSLQ